MILTTRPTAVDVTARTLVLFGKTVRINDLTELRTRTAGGGNSSKIGRAHV